MNSLTAQFSNFRRNPTPNENEVDLSMLWLTAKVLILRLNGQSAFYARMAWQKVSFPLRNYVQSSKTWQDLQQLTKFHLVFLCMKSIKKEDLESTIKNYHPKHHKSCTANYGCNLLAWAQSKCRKILKNEKESELLTSLPPTTRHQSKASVTGKLICCFCHEILTNLCAAVAYQAKRTKNDVKLILSLTKKWIDMVKVINDGVLLRKLSDGAVAAKEL